MATKKTKKPLKCLESVIPPKPLIKEFLSQDDGIIDFLQIRLPHMYHTVKKINLVFTNGEKRCYRVNWYETYQDGICTVNTIKNSELVCVTSSPDGYILERIK